MHSCRYFLIPGNPAKLTFLVLDIMENLSASSGILPGIGGHASAVHTGFDIGAIPGMDAVQKLFLKFGLDPSLLGSFFSPPSANYALFWRC